MTRPISKRGRNNRQKPTVTTNTENEQEEQNISLESLNSIRVYPRNNREDSSEEDLNDIADLVQLPDISTVKRKEDKFYQHLLPIEDGIYDGTVNDRLLREGLGVYNTNDGKEYYSGVWKNDKPHGYGYRFENYGSSIYHGFFENQVLKEGFGKVKLENGYVYEGKIENGKFHGLGSLSIKIQGLQPLDSPGIEKDTLSLIAMWDNGKTRVVFANGIEQYYAHQYQVFQYSLDSIISSNIDDLEKKRRDLQRLIPLVEERVSSNLLDIIAKHPELPTELKLAADLLQRLDTCYDSLKKYTKLPRRKSYSDCLKQFCETGLKTYARRLAWVHYDNGLNTISAREIFQDDLNSFAKRTKISELKTVLEISPIVVGLIQKMINFADERLKQVCSDNHCRTYFIKFHTDLIKNVWKGYFKKLTEGTTTSQSDYEIDRKCYFYTDCYLNLLELPLIDQCEFNIEIKLLLGLWKNSSVQILVNENPVLNKTETEFSKILFRIVLDGRDGKFKSVESIPLPIEGNQSDDLTNLIEKDANHQDVILLGILRYKSNSLSEQYQKVIEDLGSSKIKKLKENDSWIFIVKKNGEKIDERIYSTLTDSLLTHKVRFKVKEEMKIEENKVKNYIESIIYEAMIFTLNNLKPWEDFPANEWSNFLHEGIRTDISTKEIGDKLLIQILKCTKDKIKEIMNANSQEFSDTLESLIVYFQNNILRDKTSNLQIKMKEIIKIIDYLLQISEGKNSHISDLIDLQLKSIKVFIENTQNTKDVIDHFLNFNVAFNHVSQKFLSSFSSHQTFNRIASNILSSIKDIFKHIILEDTKEVSENQSRETYVESDLENSLQDAVYRGDTASMRRLLDLGANVNARGRSSGKTALHWAIAVSDENIKLQLISYLLERGANIYIEDNEGKSPFDYATELEIDLSSLADSIQQKKKYKLNELENKLSALQQMNNFLHSLSAVDLKWYVERERIIDPIDSSLFQQIQGKEIYEVLDIEKAKAKVKDPCPHYALNAIQALVKLINDKSEIHRENQFKFKTALLMAIGKSFKYFNDQLKYNSLVQFENDCVMAFKDLIVENDSYKIFCDKLEKIDLYFLYNRKLKEITLEKALEEFQKANANLSNQAGLEKFFVDYEAQFKSYFDQIIAKKSIEEIIEETKSIANKSKFKRDDISKIIAGLSVILSLKVSNFLEIESGKYVLKEKYNDNYLLKPHCIQILGVFLLLDINSSNKDIPPNHLAEILTGQGKSWALGLLAGYFSLMGYEVTVACYSDYLSRRDQNDFKNNFDPFKFKNQVKYKTFENMCDEKISGENNRPSLRDIIANIMSGKSLDPKMNQANQNKPSILLIDEVDVFCSSGFGNMYYPVTHIKDKHIGEMQKTIWEEIRKGNRDKTHLKNLANSHIVKSSSQSEFLSHLIKFNIIEKHLDRMINTALSIDTDIEKGDKLRNKYRIIDEIIHSKNRDGKLSKTTFYGYETSFYYLKLMYEKQNSFDQVPLKQENFGYISIQCGTISYSELPNSYNGRFGVSGTLKDLSTGEKSLLEHYKIFQQSYYPSFFGGSRLEFDTKTDFVIEETLKEWFNKIVMKTRSKIQNDRAILIFFETEELLDEFYTSYSGDLGVIPYCITTNKIISDKETKFYSDDIVDKLIKDEYAGHHRHVTLLTKEFGRGVDFQAEAKVNDKGGMHVIQTFFSTDIKEETQIKGRTARKDESGSYELVLCLEHLTSATKNTTYSELDEQRREKANSLVEDKMETIKKNKEVHDKTLSFYQDAISECNDTNRRQFIERIKELQD